MVPTFVSEILISGVRFLAKPSNGESGKYILNSTKKNLVKLFSIYLEFQFSRVLTMILTFDFSVLMICSGQVMAGGIVTVLKCQSPISFNFHAQLLIII